MLSHSGIAIPKLVENLKEKTLFVMKNISNILFFILSHEIVTFFKAIPE